jgi:Ca2+-binding RTX toxin-like protein
MFRVMAGGAVSAALLVCALTGSAQAAQISGTPGSDRIRGTGQADVIDGATGDDRIGARSGPDTVTGGDGLDRLWGGRGADRLFGGLGEDRIWGGHGHDQSWGEGGNDTMGGAAGHDRQWGGAGNDTIYAARGRDETWGEDGDDQLWAMARVDVRGRNDRSGDVLHGGNGNDTFRVRDGEADTVDCGPGIDTVYADYKDVLTNPGECEVVNRARRAKKGEDQRENVDPAEDVAPRS